MLRSGAAALMRASASAGAARASSTTAAATLAPKAATLIIGNEVLTGKTLDKNSHDVAKLMFECGVDHVRVEVIPDEVPEIARTIRRLSELVGPDGFVFTSGGIGPTHDDVTYDGVAAAFGAKLAYHEPTVAALRAYLESKGKAQDLNEARLRMALLPVGCEALPTPGLWVPLVRMSNVYVLPGIPSLFTKMLHAQRPRFKGPSLSRVLVYTQWLEGDLAAHLNAAVERFPGVSIGSYPNTSLDAAAAATFKVKISVEGRDAAACEACSAFIQERIQGWR